MPHEIEKIEEQLGYCEDSAKRLLKRVHELRAEYMERIECLNTLPFEEATRECIDRSQRDEKSCRSIWYPISQLCEMFFDTCRLISSTVEIEDEEALLGYEGLDICVKRIESAIVVYLPVMPHSIYNSRKNANAHLFSSHVSAKIEAVLAAMRYEDLSLFARKMVCYFYVFPEETKVCADSDNYDTKALTDAIVRNLPGGDRPGMCDFYYKTVFSDAIKRGVYIIAIPQSGTEFLTKIDLTWLENAACALHASRPLAL